jgi:hypothetical protein
MGHAMHAGAGCGMLCERVWDAMQDAGAASGHVLRPDIWVLARLLQASD